MMSIVIFEPHLLNCLAKRQEKVKSEAQRGSVACVVSHSCRGGLGFQQKAGFGKKPVSAVWSGEAGGVLSGRGGWL